VETMAERDHKEDAAGTGGELDRFDCGLNAALAKYASIEPRAGLEGRILAGLRATSQPVLDRGFWRWRMASVAAALALALMVAFNMTWKSGIPGHENGTPPSTTAQASQPGAQRTPASEANGVRPRQPSSLQKSAGRRTRPQVMNTVQARLDQFPSPQPLSEQERILASYVAKYPEHAALVAQARAEALQKEIEEETDAATKGSVR
jgi:hypothetical protein